jgi:uncharacterized membrane protein
MERPGILIEQRNLDGLRAWTHVIYALHAWSVVAGIVTPALVLTAFLLGWPSILAVIFNYIKRSDTKGTLYESHFRWQIRTFWFAVPWALAGLALWLTLLLIPVAIVLWILTGVWVAYRVIRGWITLLRNRPI